MPEASFLGRNEFRGDDNDGLYYRCELEIAANRSRVIHAGMRRENSRRDVVPWENINDELIFFFLCECVLLVRDFIKSLSIVLCTRVNEYPPVRR